MLSRPDSARFLKAERDHMEKIGPKGLKCFKTIAKSQLPAGTKLMRNRWVYAFKHSGGVLEASARLTAKGYTQTEGKH